MRRWGPSVYDHPPTPTPWGLEGGFSETGGWGTKKVREVEEVVVARVRERGSREGKIL